MTTAPRALANLRTIAIEPTSTMSKHNGGAKIKLKLNVPAVVRLTHLVHPTPK